MNCCTVAFNHLFQEIIVFNTANVPVCISKCLLKSDELTKDFGH